MSDTAETLAVIRDAVEYDYDTRCEIRGICKAAINARLSSPEFADALREVVKRMVHNHARVRIDPDDLTAMIDERIAAQLRGAVRPPDEESVRPCSGPDMEIVEPADPDVVDVAKGYSRRRGKLHTVARDVAVSIAKDSVRRYLGERTDRDHIITDSIKIRLSADRTHVAYSYSTDHDISPLGLLGLDGDGNVVHDLEDYPDLEGPQ